MASKSIRNYKKVRVGALADQEMGRWWSINSLIMPPEIKFKCSQKQPKTKKQRYNYKNMTVYQGWGQVHRYFYLPVLKYIFSRTCLYFVLELQKCTCTCTQVHYEVLST